MVPALVAKQISHDASQPEVSTATRIAVLLTFGAIYFAAGKCGLRFAIVHPSATAIWAPTGIALAACLVWGRWLWPAILAGAFLVNVTTFGSVATSLCIAIGNTLEALLGSCFIDHLAGGQRVFERTRDTFKFLLLAAIVSTAAAATIGVSSLCIGGYARWPDYGWIWLTWWLGDAAGDLIVAPMLILWAVDHTLNWSRAQKAEAVMLLMAVAATGGVVFGGWLPLGQQYPTVFLCFPVLLWAAFRFSPREAATVTFALAGLAIVGTLQGTGPFAHGNSNQALLLLQTFTGMTGVIAIAVATEIGQRQRLDEARAHLAAIVDSSDDAVIGLTLDPRITAWNESATRIFGFTAAEAIGQPISIITPPEKRIEQEKLVASVARAEAFRHFETVGLCKTGHQAEIAVTMSPIRGADGRVIGASTIARDISKDKGAQQQLQKLLNSEQTARAEAEKAVSKLRRLQMVSDVALQDLTLEKLMPALLDRLRAALSADAAAILLVAPDGQHLSPTSSVGLREEPRGVADLKIPLGRGNRRPNRGESRGPDL